jgi:hypothetical protein
LVSEGGPRPAPKSKTAASAKAAAPEFKVQMAGSVKLHTLSLPTALGAITNARPTIAVGKSHLIIATDLAAAKEALGVEAKASPGGTQALSEDVAAAIGAMPKEMVGLLVTDPRGSIPRHLADLPATLRAGIPMGVGIPAGPPAAAGAEGAPAPGVPTAPAGGGRGRGGRRGEDDEEEMKPGSVQFGQGSIAGSGRPRITPPGQGAGDAGGGREVTISPRGGAPAQPPGSSPPAAAPMAKMVLDIDPSLAPNADQIAAFLFPGAVSLAVDDLGIRFVSRQAFYDLGGSADDQQLLNALISQLGVAAPMGGAVPAGEGAPPAAGVPAQPPGGGTRGLRGGRAID